VRTVVVPSIARRARRTVIVAAALLALAPIALAGAAGSVPPPHWIARGQFPAVQQFPNTISCPTSTACVELGASGDLPGSEVAFYSSDGGATWLQGEIPQKTGDLRSLSCASATACVATGVDQLTGVVSIVATADGGQHWTTQMTEHLSPSASSVVSCAPGGDCMAILNGPLGTVTAANSADAGATWTASTPFAGLHLEEITDVSCPSAGVCVATGATSTNGWIGRTADDGATWTTQTIPAAVEIVKQVSCGSATLCLAIASGTNTTGSLSTTNGGATWTYTAVQRLYFAVTILCLASGTCYAPTYAVPVAGGVRDSLLISADTGATWHSMTLPPSSAGLADVSCSADTTCVLVGSSVGGDAQVLLLDGSTVSPIAASLDRYVSVQALACATAERCVGVGTSPTAIGTSAVALTTTSAGANWAVTGAQPPFSTLLALACPTASWCFAVGTELVKGSLRSVVARSSSGGLTWEFLPPVEQNLFLYGLSCATSATCVAVSNSSDVLRTTNRGSTWQYAALPGAFNEVSVACPTTRLCVAAGADVAQHPAVWRSIDGGAHWSFVRQFAGLDGSDEITCNRPGVCLVAGSRSSTVGDVWRSDDAGRTWALAHLPASTFPIDSVSCAAGSLCYALGSLGSTEVLRSVDRGAHFSRVPAPQGASSVSCGPSGCWLIASSSTGIDLYVGR
jgi:hypothetical protein